MEKHLEVRATEYKGIKVMVKIDYDQGIISLVERKDAVMQSPTFDAKKWVFANRGIEYMQGWLDILEAMSLAVKDAKSDLERVQKAREAKKNKIVVDLILKKK